MPLDTLLAPNPLLLDWTGPFGLPPFDQIQADHYGPALREAMRQQLLELDALAACPEPPDADNTLAAFDRAGALLYRVSAVLSNLAASETSPALQAVQREMAAPLAAHESAVKMHAGVFRRIDELHARRAHAGLTPEQLRLLERLHLDFVQAGAKLSPEAQPAYAQIMQDLANLTTRFSQNVLADEAASPAAAGRRG